MEFSLKVLSGKHAGKVIKVPGSTFLIGRSEECHLRPASDLISRQHCQFTVHDDNVTVADKGSRNGTFVNGERIAAPTILKPNDKVSVGELIFEIQLPRPAVAPEPVKTDTVATSAPLSETQATKPKGPAKAPKVKDVADVANRVTNKKDVDEDDISDWLNGDDMDALNETSTIQLSQTQQMELLAAAEQDLGSAEDEIADEKKTGTQIDPKTGKKVYGKLPPIPKKQSDSKDSREAAADILRKMMNKR
jgi:pSer/pThr/pTyr-binding forkhead associated (FHA) protein